jgi:hypothetical protein
LQYKQLGQFLIPVILFLYLFFSFSFFGDPGPVCGLSALPTFTLWLNLSSLPWLSKLSAYTERFDFAPSVFTLMHSHTTVSRNTVVSGGGAAFLVCQSCIILPSLQIISAAFYYASAVSLKTHSHQHLLPYPFTYC